MKLSIYFIHSKVVANRVTNVNQLVDMLTKSGAFEAVTSTLVDEYEADSLSQEVIRASTDFSQIPLEAGAEQLAQFNSLIAPMHVRHVSNLLKHVEALKRISASTAGDDTAHVVLEDDVVYGDRVADALKTALTNGGACDLLFLGLPSAQLAGATEPDRSPCSDFKTFYNVSPVCDAYAVTPAGAAKLVGGSSPSLLLPMKFATNVQLSFAIQRAPDLKACFSRPNVFIDGSKLGVFVSSVETNNALILSGEYQALKTLVDANDVEGARKAFETLRFKTHPDNVRLLAEAEHKAGNFEKSKGLYEACFQAYATNGCVLNNQSQFLRSYVGACKDFY